MMREWRGVLHQLVGFENERQDGEGSSHNFILSNGTRSAQRVKGYETKYTFMIPADALNRIRSVAIYHEHGCITGFSFFDKDGVLLW